MAYSFAQIFRLVKKLIYLGAYILLPFCINAQAITGIVYEKDSKQPVSGASVSIENAEQMAVTSTIGVFHLRGLEDGTYTLNISHVSYQPQRITGVQLKNGVADSVFVLLENVAGTTLDEVVVTSAARSRESFTSLNIERKKSILVIQKIGADEMSLKGISNVGEGVSKLVGVSMVGNRSLFVRGLGDRYNIATLNGLPIPSTNPDEKLIPLEIFPSAIVQNIGVVKSYSAPYYGDFSGGTIDIVTKATPAQPFLTIGVSAGMNSITTGQDFYRAQNRTFLQKQGYGRNVRGFSETMKNDLYFNTNDGKSVKFHTPWSPKLISAPVDNGVSIAGGKTFRMENGSRLGVIFTGSQKNEFRRTYGRSSLYNANKVYEYLFNTENHVQANNTTALLGFTFRPGSNRSTINWTNLFVNDATTDIYAGEGDDQDLGGVLYRRNTFIQNTLLSTQVSGNNRLGEGSKSELNWAAGYTKTIGSMPDRITNGFYTNGNGAYTFITNQSGADQQRYQYDLDDNDASAKVEYVRKPENSSIADYRIGLDGRYKFRTFDVAVLGANFNGLAGTPVDIDNVDALITPSNTSTPGAVGMWSLRNDFNATNNYRAALAVAAPYVNVNFNWNNAWNLVLGVRGEAYDQTIEYHMSNDASDAPFRDHSLRGIDILPGATLKRILNGKSNVLFAASRTLTRPLFVESAPFRINTAAGTVETEGNPFLKNSSIYNADLKYEYYPSAGEIIAIGIFGKHLQNPIERMLISSSEVITSYINSDRALVLGVEFEFYRNLGKMFDASSDALNNMSIGFNGSYMHTNIHVNPEKIRKETYFNVAPTNFERPLFGASPYLVNLDYTYRANWSENSFSTFALTFNRFGKRLFMAGTEGAGDVYEMPVNSLNIAINNQLAKNLSVNLRAENVLNPNIQFLQQFADGNLEYANFRKGINASLGLSYTF